MTPPAPLTPPGCDLKDFKFMPLDVARLRDSDIAAKSSGDEFRCAVLLWCASWHQVPAASLPDDDIILSQLAGYGRVVKEWQKVRHGALRGWVVCSDGRLYHPVVAEKASEAWLAKLRQRLKTECARIKKHNERHKTSIPFPEFDAWMEAGCPVGQALFVPSDNPPKSPGQGGSVAGEKQSKGQGEGQGEGELKAKADDDSPGSGGALSSLPPHFDEAGFAAPGSAPLPPREDPPPSNDAAIALAVSLRKLGVDATFTHPAVLGWVERQVTPQMLHAAVVLAREQKGPTAKIPPNYLVPIVEKLLNPPATAPGAQGRTAQTAPPTPSRKPQGNDPKGTDETYDEWQSRVDAYERAQRQAKGR